MKTLTKLYENAYSSNDFDLCQKVQRELNGKYDLSKDYQYKEYIKETYSKFWKYKTLRDREVLKYIK